MVSEQKDGLFKGTMTYISDIRQPEFEGKASFGHVHTEDVLGIIEWDNMSLVWVYHLDETVHKARLIDDRTMQVIAYESGEHAVVLRSVIVKD